MDGYKFNPNVVQAALASAARVLITLITGFTALLGILSRGDMAGLYNYIQSADGLTLITACIAVITFGFSIWTKIQERKALASAAPLVPNSVLEAKK